MLPSGVRALGLTGALAYPVTLLAFSVSVMVMDHFSVRYLAAMTLMTPFALAPLLHRVGARRGFAVVLPCVLASAYVWDPGRSRETLTEAEDTVRREARRVSRREVGTLVVFLVER
jgi:hypothetical protein